MKENEQKGLQYRLEDESRLTRAWNIGLAFMESYETPLTGLVSMRALRGLAVKRMTEAGISPVIGDDDESKRGDLRASTDAAHHLGLRKKTIGKEVLVHLSAKNAENVRRFLQDPETYINGDAIVTADDLIAAVGERRTVTLDRPAIAWDTKEMQFIADLAKHEMSPTEIDQTLDALDEESKETPVEATTEEVPNA